MTGLGHLAGDSHSESMAVSVDGSVIVGRSSGGGPAGYDGFRWEDGVMTILSSMPRTIPQDVSDDGSIVVGILYTVWGDGYEAFRWEDGDIIGLGYLTEEGDASYAHAVSGDGALIVGYDETALGREAFIWDASNGMRSLADVLENDCGLDLTGWTLKAAENISNNGLTIVGWGINPDGYSEAWVATIPEPSTLLLLGLGAVRFV